MQQGLLQEIVNFRRDLHQHPEKSFQEFETHKRIKKFLLQLGVKAEWITQYNREGQKSTGMIVDLYGAGEAKGQPFCVAFRADIDALTMEELNVDLPYKSENPGLAHMCGHDGHTACLVGFVPLFLKEAHSIPNNKRIRLLFQPSEEGPLSGAQFMIKKGCLEGVNQVYGFHNWPTGKFGELWCKDGAVMSQISVIQINIIGDGGHGSAPENLKVAIWEAIFFYTRIQQYVKQLQQEKRNFACTFPVFHSGQRFNVIHEKATIQGTLRTFDVETRDLVLNKIKQILAVSENKGFKVELKIETSCLTANTKKQSDNVLRVAKQFLGEDKAGPGALPFRASQDFGFYTQVRPGAYFFFCTNKQEKQVSLHNGRFNFKDELIEIASVFWLKLAQDRLAN